MREQIVRPRGAQPIAVRRKDANVACERGRAARDVQDASNAELGDRCAARRDAATRRIENEKIVAGVVRAVFEEGLDGLGEKLDVVQPMMAGAGKAGGGRRSVAFDRIDVLDVTRDRQREVPGARVEIQYTSRPRRAYSGDHIFGEAQAAFRVDLSEASPGDLDRQALGGRQAPAHIPPCAAPAAPPHDDSADRVISA